VTVKEGVATFTPMRSNPDRVNLYTDGTHDALKVFYYRSKNQNVYISKGSSFIMIHESVLTGIQQAFKKYQRRKFDVPKPRPSGVDYPPPPERKESRRGRR
jgi:ATP-dependent protease ClpP protease subunit